MKRPQNSRIECSRRLCNKKVIYTFRRCHLQRTIECYTPVLEGQRTRKTRFQEGVGTVNHLKRNLVVRLYLVSITGIVFYAQDPNIASLIQLLEHADIVVQNKTRQSLVGIGDGTNIAHGKHIGGRFIR